ncbi:MAG: hypothetical protein IJ158_10030 [Treponema sp.]|mgnify:CR=1 FL=1|nr:hypothetical protein [Treponema sp.]
MKKRILLPSLFFLSSIPSLFATTFFSGETGIAAKFTNDSVYEFDPTFGVDGYFAGQFALTNNLSLRGEFSIQTGDIFAAGLTKDVDSVFRINELSATYIKTALDTTHTFSLFTGYFENIGTQQFIQRHLHVQNYASPLTETYLGQSNANAFSIYGIGGEYSVTFKQIPLAVGLIFNKSGKNGDNPQLNLDLRGATSFRYVTIDLLGGLNGENKTTNAFIHIDTVYVHLGLDMLIGNNYTPFAFYTQAGLSYLMTSKSNETSDFDIKQLYFLVEPRFQAKGVRFSITAYNIPQDQVNKLFFIDETLGANFRLYLNELHTSKREYAVGLNAGADFTGKFMNNFTDSDIIDSMNIKISPFAEIEALGGKIEAMLKLNVSNLMEENKTVFKFHVGYRREL